MPISPATHLPGLPSPVPIVAVHWKPGAHWLLSPSPEMERHGAPAIAYRQKPSWQVLFAEHWGFPATRSRTHG